MSKKLLILLFALMLVISTASAAKLSLDEMTETLNGNGEFTIDGMDSTVFWSTQTASASWQHVIDLTGNGDISYDMLEKYTYAELEEKIRAFSSHDIADVEIIGTSVEGRSIYSVSVGTGTSNILIVTGLHAREPAGTAYLMSQLVDLVTAYESGDERTERLLSMFSIVSVPCGNPDGRAMLDNADNTDWRANANGVDLGLNFPASCAGQYSFSSHQALHETMSGSSGYAGDYLGSEPETIALMGWLEEYIDNAVIYVGYEQYGRLIYPESSYLTGSEYRSSLDLAEDLARFLSREDASYKVDDSRTYLRGWGDGSAADYAAELGQGLLFSEEYGRLGLEVSGRILPLALYEDAELFADDVMPRAPELACVTIEISTKGGTGYYDNARRNHKGEYDNCGWSEMLYHLMEYSLEEIDE